MQTNPRHGIIHSKTTQLKMEDRKNNSNQTHSCSRDWRLSASRRPHLKFLEPSQHYIIEGFKGVPQLGLHYTEGI